MANPSFGIFQGASTVSSITVADLTGQAPQAGLGKINGMEIGDGKLYALHHRVVAGDPGRISEWTIDTTNNTVTFVKSIPLQNNGYTISDPGSLTFNPDTGTTWLGNSADCGSCSKIYKINWDNMINNPTTTTWIEKKLDDDAGIYLVSNSTQSGGSRIEYVKLGGTWYIATADLMDTVNNTQRLRIYDPVAMETATNTNNASVLKKKFLVSQFSQNLYWDDVHNILLLVQNSTQGVGWRYEWIDLPALFPQADNTDSANFRVEAPFVPSSQPAELEGFGLISPVVGGPNKAIAVVGASSGTQIYFKNLTYTMSGGNSAPTISSVTSSPSSLTLPSNSSTLNCAASDDNLPTPGLTYAWTKTAGPSATFSSTTVYNPTVTYTGGAGTYTFQCTVSDSAPLSANASVTVVVSEGGGGQVTTTCTMLEDNHIKSGLGNQGPSSIVNTQGSSSAPTYSLWRPSLSCTPALPSGKVIVGGTIRFKIYSSSGGSANTFEAFELKKAWTEAGSTWTNWAAGSTWLTAGAGNTSDPTAPDRGATVIGSIGNTFSLAANAEFSMPLNAAGVQVLSNWYGGAAINGFIIRPVTTSSDALQVYSSEATTVSYRPVMDVTYQ